MSTDIDRFEKTFGRRLPFSFRQYLLWRNGGMPYRSEWQRDTAPYVDLHWPTHVNTKNVETNVDFVIRYDDDSSSSATIHYFLENFNDIPLHITPVARSPGNSLFFADMREGPEPRILFGPYIDIEDAAFVADNFTSFLDSLKPDE